VHAGRLRADTPIVVSFFTQAGSFVRCETREGPGETWELLIVQPDGTEVVEQFDDSAAMAQRQAELTDCLVRAGWFGPHERRI